MQVWYCGGFTLPEQCCVAVVPLSQKGGERKRDGEKLVS